MKYRKLIKQLNNYQLFRILMKRRDKTVKIKVKTKALVSVLLSFVMIMGLLFVPQVYAEDQPDQPNTISFQSVRADLENVSVYLEINGQMKDAPVSYSSGLITDHIDSVKEQVGETTFQKAVVRSENNGQVTENEIVRVGNYDGDTYYSLTGNEDTGIMLEDNEQIILIFSSSYTITYNLTPSEGGKMTSQETVYYGQALPVTITANDNYTIHTINYQIGSHTSQNVDVSNAKEMQFTIPQGTITDNVVINVQFDQITEYNVIKGIINSGGVCQDYGYEKMAYLNDQPVDPISAGSDATFMLYSQSWTGWDRYYITKLTINNENINIPLDYTTDTPGVTTTLSNGSIVTVTLIQVGGGLYWLDGDPWYTLPDNPTSSWNSFIGWHKQRCFYEVKVTNVREDLVVDVNFKLDSERQVTLTGLQGIEKIGAASEYAYNQPDWDFRYGLQEPNEMNVYSAYHSNDYGLGITAGVAYNIYLYSVKPGYNPYSGHVKMTYFEENGNQVIKEAQMGSNGEVIDSQNLLLERNGKPWTEVQEIQSNLVTGSRFFEYDGYNWTEDVLNHGYQYGFTVNQYDSKNQILELSVDPYQYNIVFDLNGGRLSSSQYQLQDDVYIEVNNGEQIYYTLENGDVNTYMPLETPEKDDMTFLGWQLCDSEGNALTDHIYSENELFVIDEDSIQYSDGDITKNTGHTFTFKAVWGTTTASEETAVYYIKVYQEDEDGTIVGNDGKHYSEYNTYSDIGTVGKTIRYISSETSQYNPDNDLYEINNSNSQFTISNLYDETDESWEDHNVINLFFDYQRYDLTITKDAVGDYADLSRDWTIDVTLTNENDTDLSSQTFTFNDKTITLENGKISLSLQDEESFAFTNLIKGTQFTITESNPPDGYTVSYKINDEEKSSVSNQSLSTDTTVTVTNTMNNINIPDTNIPTSGMNSTMTMLAIGSIGIVGVIALLWYWRKKHV